MTLTNKLVFQSCLLKTIPLYPLFPIRIVSSAILMPELKNISISFDFQIPPTSAAIKATTSFIYSRHHVVASLFAKIHFASSFQKQKEKCINFDVKSGALRLTASSDDVFQLKQSQTAVFSLFLFQLGTRGRGHSAQYRPCWCLHNAFGPLSPAAVAQTIYQPSRPCQVGCVNICSSAFSFRALIKRRIAEDVPGLISFYIAH